jgi:hypothetical protein
VTTPTQLVPSADLSFGKRRVWRPGHMQPAVDRFPRFCPAMEHPFPIILSRLRTPKLQDSNLGKHWVCDSRHCASLGPFLSTLGHVAVSPGPVYFCVFPSRPDGSFLLQFQNNKLLGPFVRGSSVTSA